MTVQQLVETLDAKILDSTNIYGVRHYRLQYHHPSENHNSLHTLVAQHELQHLVDTRDS